MGMVRFIVLVSELHMIVLHAGKDLTMHKISSFYIFFFLYNFTPSKDFVGKLKGIDLDFQQCFHNIMSFIILEHREDMLDEMDKIVGIINFDL